MIQTSVKPPVVSKFSAPKAVHDTPHACFYSNRKQPYSGSFFLIVLWNDATFTHDAYSFLWFRSNMWCCSLSQQSITCQQASLAHKICSFLLPLFPSEGVFGFRLAFWLLWLHASHASLFLQTNNALNLKPDNTIYRQHCSLLLSNMANAKESCI